MKVDLDNLRRNAARDFNKLIKTLNGETWNSSGHNYWNDFTDREKEAFDDLRRDIGFLLCCYSEDDPEMNVVDDIELVDVFIYEDEE